MEIIDRIKIGLDNIPSIDIGELSSFMADMALARTSSYYNEEKMLKFREFDIAQIRSFLAPVARSSQSNRNNNRRLSNSSFGIALIVDKIKLLPDVGNSNVAYF